MSVIVQSKQFTTLEQCSNGGKSRAAKLSPERRKEISVKANSSRKCLQGIPKATHYGKLKFGDVEVDCAVLEDGRSIITETSLFNLFGMKRKGRVKIKGTENGESPKFLMSKSLQEHIPSDLRGGTASFDIYMPRGGKAYAYDANTVTQILKAYYNANKAGSLHPNQIPIALTAEVILMALADTGLVALIHESTGFQKDREMDALQQLFSKFIAKELQPWVRRFPVAFFDHMKRMYGLQEMKKTPSFVGHLINRWIYAELSPEIHEELKRLNPVTESGHRKHCHHQLLTQDIGCPALDRQILKVTTLMSASEDKEDFERLLEKSKRS